ncbi:MATE family efflux transporter [Ahrensia marina]|uniref:XRE family transcriptional regulator n=1 Tax=Ahrensia marina TaxID=1514904 RepID=A0A0M9GPR2_9HYPH|nr:MATE family efflux transporter [Ahrensia marina]KPB02486.1 XRE family transcriptional regulator [Ahrensia marina]
MNMAAPKLEITNRMVLGIAVPMTIAFLTVPLLGLVDTAIVGQFGQAALIGGLAVGVVIFDIVFATFNFLRTGTTGFVAQALGRGNQREQQAWFWRSIITATVIGILILPLSPIIRELGLYWINPESGVREAATTYMVIRFLGAPFSLINYAILGMLLGQDRPMASLGVQTLVNGLNIILSVVLGLVLGWNIVGVAWGTVLAEAAVAIASFIWLWRGFDQTQKPAWAEVLDRASLLKMVSVNRDIMIRSFALLIALTLFTRLGANMGTVTLAANAILLNFFFVSSYFLDGLAAASEQLAGRAIGVGSRAALWQAIRKSCGFGFALSFLAAALLLAFGDQMIDMMTTAEGVREAAKTYLPWAALTPVAGVLAFQMDGVFIGATWSVDMRNMMLLSLLVFVVLGYTLPSIFGNHGIWVALNAWLFLRGVSLLFVLPKRASEI